MPNPTLDAAQIAALISAYAARLSISEKRAVYDLAEVAGADPTTIYRYRARGIGVRASRLTRLALVKLASEHGIIETAEHEAAFVEHDSRRPDSETPPLRA